MTQPTDADRLVAEARRAVHESLTLLPAQEADRVRSLIADLETAVEGRAAMRATAAPPANETHGLSVQHADALWDAIATPGPHKPTFMEQHKRVCHTVARILEELTPIEEPTADAQHMSTRMQAAAVTPDHEHLLRLIARWAASGEGRDVLVEGLVAAGYRLPYTGETAGGGV
jgi:hypothetical protein